MLAIESATSRDLSSLNSSSTLLSMQRSLKEFPFELLNKSLNRLNSPKTISSTLICLLGFGDNGLCLSKYGDNLANQQIELISFQFPGDLLSNFTRRIILIILIIILIVVIN